MRIEAGSRRHREPRPRTPGKPSAARILRRTVAVSSALPVDRAVGLPHQRPQRGRGRLGARHRVRPRACRQPREASSVDRGAHRRLGDFVAVEAALGCVAHRKVDRRPDSPASISPFASQRGDAPCRLAVHDRPVERRRPAVAANARMDDDAAVLPPDRFGNCALEERRDDELRRNSATASSVTRSLTSNSIGDLVAGVA